MQPGYGYLDIVGEDPAYAVLAGQDDDIAELLAAAAGAAQGGVPAGLREQVLAARLAKESTAVRTQMPLKARGYPLGFDSVVLVAAGATVTVISQPQVAFRVERLVVPSDIAGSFVIADLQVGKNSQFANDQPVPARVFDETSFGVRLRGDTAQVTMNVSQRVTNISGAAIRYRAAIIGTALDT